MNGALLSVCDELFERVWTPLAWESARASDFWTELFQCYARFLSQPSKLAYCKVAQKDMYLGGLDTKAWMGSPGYVEASTDETRAAEILGELVAECFDSEMELILFLEAWHGVCRELESEAFATKYFELFEKFLHRFNCRYELRVPFHITPTLAGMVVSLISEMDKCSLLSANLMKSKREFDEAFRDLRMGCSESRIKTCISKQFMFIEALADHSSAENGKTLGQLLKKCDWPHETMRTTSGNLYGLRSDYPGLGHGTDSKGVLRDIDSRDLVGVTLMLTGLVPYVAQQIQIDQVVYQDGVLHKEVRTVSEMKKVPIRIALTSIKAWFERKRK